MADAAGLAHPRSADDDRRIFQVVELHRVRQLADVSEVFHTEWVLFLPKEFVDAFIEAFRMETKDFGGIHAERTINKNRNAGQLIGDGKLVESIDDLLRAADGE